MTDDLLNTERQKYREAWNLVEYREMSPGERCFVPWLKIVRPMPRAMVTDFGCGTGRASMLMALAGFQVTPLDFADNCLDPEAHDVVGRNFIEACLWEKLPIVRSTYGYCCDVMEHIPPEKVDDVLRNIMDKCYEAFFLINFEVDHFGDDLGTRLHLSIHPFEWWVAKLRQFGKLIDARDLITEGLFRVVPRTH